MNRGCVCGENPHNRICPANDYLQCGCAVVKRMIGKFENGAFVTEEIDLEDTYCEKHLAERLLRGPKAPNEVAPAVDIDDDHIEDVRGKFFCESVQRDSTGKETILFFVDDAEQRRGRLTLIIDPAAPGKFKPGSTYHLEFSEAT